MSGIAEVLINQDYEVSGSDPSSNRVTDHLKTLGADIRHNHSAQNIRGKHHPRGQRRGTGRPGAIHTGHSQS